MFERAPVNRVSPFELELQRFLWKLPGRVSFVLDCGSHGRRDCAGPDAPGSDRAGHDDPEPDAAAAPALNVGATIEESAGSEAPLEARMASLAGLLETGALHLSIAADAHREQCRQTAVRARALAAFAVQRPAVVLERPDEEVGAAAAASRAARPAVLTGISEWAVDEVMVALGLSSAAASTLLAQSVAVVEQLPATLGSLEAGAISWRHAVMLADVLGQLADPDTRAAVEAGLLERAAGKTVPQLRATARRAVLRADAGAAARRLAAAIRERQVRAYPGEDGMASLTATMPIPVALACRKALEAYAEECATSGDARTKDQRMVDCLVDLMLRPGAAGEPPVSIDLTVVASVPTLTGGDEPGEIDGHPVPAVVVRELAHTLGLLPRPESPERTDTEPTGGEMTCGEVTGGEVAATDLHTACEADQLTSTRHTPPSEGSARERLTSEALTSEALTSEAPTGGPSTSGSAERGDLDPGESAAARLAGLLGIRTIAGTPLAHLPTIAVVEEISGQLLALTDVAGIRGAITCIRPACRAGRRPCTHPPAGPGLGPPPATDRYTPSTALQRFVRARDRRCRFPGCRAAAIRCDLDHNLPWPAGATAAGNLCCLCRHHHRLSHQAPGWTMHRLPDGGIEWTTPGGDRITTHPPRYGTDGDLPPPTALPTNDEPGRGRPRLTLRERVLGRPATPEERENDPPPF